MAPSGVSRTRAGSLGTLGSIESKGGLIGSVSRWWMRSYTSDWVAFSLLLVGYILIAAFVEPFHRLFTINDIRISFPHAEVERVPVSHLFAYALFLPLGLLLLTNSLLLRSPRHIHHLSILGFLTSIILTTFLTDLIKNMVGRPRPDLIARCQPRPDTPPNKLVGVEVCTQTDHHTLHDGWRSFPSGHSSFAFAGLGYLALFWCGQFRAFSSSSPAGTGVTDGMEKVLVKRDLLKALLCLSPLLGALMIAISRCMDYRHDVEDVCVGSVMGWVITYWSYRRYWPRLSSGRCEEPYSGMNGERDQGEVNGNGVRRYSRVRDEEEGVGAGGGFQRNVGTSFVSPPDVELGPLENPR
ncbi:phosphatidic acid phosphatase type 2/haloperoxidase [Pseudoneurospora amorphoporcata]|uniref:Phosphatidic acid phosphatase type 2/haloperoxidase n=1 Tax=Pseudoneurospora amorphoporcata TaxID=241081 RepID=A0AAN6P0P6_9PEZI|nr:phosphatidic acid phosphatase type 2/haloperoxidase [Pseudoneurospora amorphoporcata]